MQKIFLMFCLVFAIMPNASSTALGQSYYCKLPALKALRSVPKLKYKCREDTSDYDEKLLKFPERVAAVRRYTNSLESLYKDPRWWASSVDDLTYCDIHRKVGPLTKKDKESLHGGDYRYRLFGNRQIRVVSTDDPCFDAGYGGSDIFLLNRTSGRVFATEIIDGFSSRADNPFDVGFATLNGEQLVEIASATGGFNPMVINYYFAINGRTNRAVPKNLFKGEKGLTNTITSMMLLADPEEYGLPPKSEPLVIIKNHRLTESFSTFDQSPGDSQKFAATVRRWNGRFYQ